MEQLGLIGRAGLMAAQPIVDERELGLIERAGLMAEQPIVDERAGLLDELAALPKLVAFGERRKALDVRQF